MALSQWAWGAQDNLVGIERHGAAPAGASASSTATTQATQQPQRSLERAANAAAPASIVQTEQRNLLPAPASAPASATRATAGNEAASAVTAGGTNAPAAPSADERPLWRLLHEKRLAEFDRRVAALARDVPSWKPSRSLVGERARLQQEADIAAALNGGEPGALRLMIARAPDEFGCAHIDRVWKAADLFARTGHADEIAPLYRTVIPNCKPDANRIATLYRAEQTLPAAQADALIELEAAQGQRDGDNEAAFRRLRYQRAVAKLGAEAPDSAGSAQQLAALAPSIRAYRDGPAATLAGWIALGQHRVAEADDWLTRALVYTPDDVDATLGLAQTRIEVRAYDSAQALLEQPALRAEPRAHRARAQLALAQANAAYGQHHYRESLQWLDRATSEGLPAAQSAALHGWALYAMGKYAQAAAAFRTRYEQDHDDDMAEGLALALHAMKERKVPRDWDDAPAGSANMGPAAKADGEGRVAAYLDALDAQQLYYSKQFVASQAALRDALAGPADEQRITRYVPADLTGIDAASVAGGITWADHVGTSGQGRLDTIAPELRSEWIRNGAQYELRYRQLFLSAGTTSLDQTVPGLPDLFGSDRLSVSELADWKRAMRMPLLGGSARAEELQGMVSDTLRIGTLPQFGWRLSLGATQGGPSGFQPNTLASIGQETAWGMWSAYMGVTPVRDSLLSWRGMPLTLPDADGTDRWGAVRRAAGGTKFRWQFAPRWTISAAAEAQWLTGMNVVGNNGVSADLSSGYDFRVPGFDYFSTGPAVHYLSYRRNENFYSWGQGGYYSPQSSISTGLALQWLSNEGRRWQWQGNLEAGWNNTVQHTERCFPLGLPSSLADEIAGISDPDHSAAENQARAATLSCAGSHDHGIYTHAQVSAVVKLSPLLQAGVLADVNVTPGRDKQFAALAFVRYFLAPRAAVFSRDLPRNTRDFYMQLDDNH
ncbi:cellulose synthase subunit BcsC-related outer membrane protein [Trinickia symbiotica]|uniref:cellulose synthase subunit BcsC-related outer membrane protein n=1 Tax=Trinickia symbiotica TaxID=863227 RepID=UPI000370D631|nr:cellulose synthase subunit BcsC-related outer membrane protein [Trinickia symbiotica]